MSEIAISTPDKEDGAKPECDARSRILRYDELYDFQKSQVRLVKSVKSDIKRQKSRKAVLRVRRVIDKDGIHSKTEVDIISKRISQIMQGINSDVENISLNKNPPVVPLELFYHNRLALQAHLDKAKVSEPKDEELISDLVETVKFTDDDHAITKANLEPLLSAREITWDLLWAIFPPNILVYRYHRFTEQDQILKLRTITCIQDKQDKTRYWSLGCHIVADDGIKFGLALEPMFTTIEEFTGARKIADLGIFPLEYHEKESEIRASALSRGRRLAEFLEPRVMETSGPAMFEKRTVRYEPYQVKIPSHGRMIIDPAGFRSVNSNIRFVPKVHSSLSRESLTEEQLIICTPVMLGFCFGTSKWGGYALSRLIDVKWNLQAFDDLVLGESTKTLVHSMVKQHSSTGDSFDDIISGKGRGIICLFSGPPGSGKTLTAEAVAEITRRPLYSVSAGNLGIEPKDVDQKLSEILELSHKWNSVLLLDEADVFLHQRDSADIQRNALVTIFLRQLEYYQGILILTTNRVADCDAAFKSRIHIPISYPDLDESARRKIWAMFLRRAKTTPEGSAAEISEDDISQLAKKNMNGRNIKNIFRSASIIARAENKALSMSHIEIVLSAIKSGFKAIEPT